MRLKKCRKCGLDLPLHSFTSTMAKYCNNCRIIRKFEQQKASQQRSFERMKNKKQKTTGVVKLSDLKQVAQRHVNKFIRERDKNLPCISCQKKPVEHAGHYIAQGSSGLLRYEPDNISGQCKQCNKWKHGNLLEYRIHLVEKIGEDRVKELEALRYGIKKWTREELLEIIEEYKEKLKCLK